ncbi:hypothetical protein IFVP203_C2170082 [Vibrio parahaemolyticus]
MAHHLHSLDVVSIVRWSKFSYELHYGCNLDEKSLSCPAKLKDQHHEPQEENQSDLKSEAEEAQREAA